MNHKKGTGKRNSFLWAAQSIVALQRLGFYPFFGFEEVLLLASWKWCRDEYRVLGNAMLLATETNVSALLASKDCSHLNLFR